MAQQSRRTLTLNVRPAVETIGLVEFIRQVGLKEIIKEVGPMDLVANLSAADRRMLKRLLAEEGGQDPGDHRWVSPERS